MQKSSGEIVIPTILSPLPFSGEPAAREFSGVRRWIFVSEVTSSSVLLVAVANNEIAWRHGYESCARLPSFASHDRGVLANFLYGAKSR